MRRLTYTVGLVAIVTSLAMAVPACSAPGRDPSVPTAAGASPTSTALSPTTAAPTVTAPPSRPAPSSSTSTGPRTTTPAAAPITCTGHVALSRSEYRGVGPLGSLVATGSTSVALTFDDGPDPVNTPRILDLLRQCDVKATFCLVGHRARDNPDLVRRIYEEGHTLCNHSWQHLDLSHPPATISTGKPYTILDDLRATNNAIHAAVPGAPIAYFRAPYGAWTPDVIAAARALHMTPLDWSVDPRDWDSATFGSGARLSRHVVNAVEATVHPGSIVLSHDNVRPDTIVAYRTLLPWLKARFVLIALPVDVPAA